MKNKTSKYTALIIIILGILFIYFIPKIFGNIWSDTELGPLFDKSEVVYLVDNIALFNGKELYGTIVGIINKNKIPLRYQVGDNEFIGWWFNVPEGAKIPEGAILFLEYGPNYIHNAGNSWYFNSGKLKNGYTFEQVKQAF